MRNFRKDMQRLVRRIKKFSKRRNKDFLIIVNNGEQLLTKDGNSKGIPDKRYLNALNGFSIESLVYGYPDLDSPSSVEIKEIIVPYLELAKRHGLLILVIDYCINRPFIEDSYKQNLEREYISFSAESRLLNTVPAYPERPFNENSADIASINEAKNFLYLINPSFFPERRQFLDRINETNYDMIFIDLFFGNQRLKKSDIDSLKTKANGGRRLIFSYMSVGEASDFRYYWNSSWVESPPKWLEKGNPNWPGSFKVRFWEREWHRIIYNGKDSYLSMIIDSGFDGVYLDLVDSFEYFEEHS